MAWQQINLPLASMIWGADAIRVAAPCSGLLLVCLLHVAALLSRTENSGVWHYSLARVSEHQRELLSHTEMLFYVTGKRHPAVRTAATLMTSTLIAAVAARSSLWLQLPVLPLWIFRAAWNSGSSSTVIISGWNNVPGSEGSILGRAHGCGY